MQSCFCFKKNCVAFLWNNFYIRDLSLRLKHKEEKNYVQLTLGEQSWYIIMYFMLVVIIKQLSLKKIFSKNCAWGEKIDV